jgi:hypothetical protein
VVAGGGAGATPLHWACHLDDAGAVSALLDAGADPNRANRWGRTALHVAVRRGCADVARLLIARGADLHAPTREGWTPLHVAQRCGRPEMVELLIAAGADPARADAEGRVAADDAFVRPPAAAAGDLDAYIGLYELGPGVEVKVWREADGLHVREFAPDALYPTGPDAFFCVQEPWALRFERDADGVVNAVTIDYLRRQVRAVRRAAPRYVGSQACAECHLDRELGAQHLSWIRGRHAGAWWRLATDWAVLLASFRPHYTDVTDPIADSRCTRCHWTAAQDDDALLATGFRREEGVGCEACHGPGSEYMDPEVMADRERFLAAGGVVPDEAVCRKCHRDDAFVFAERVARIAHPRPALDAADGVH